MGAVGSIEHDGTVEAAEMVVEQVYTSFAAAVCEITPLVIVEATAVVVGSMAEEMVGDMVAREDRDARVEMPLVETAALCVSGEPLLYCAAVADDASSEHIEVVVEVGEAALAPKFDR